MTVFRLHLRPKGGLADPRFSFKYCLKNSVLGLGWQTDSHTNGSDWGSYEKEASKLYGTKALSRVRYLRNHVKKGDLIWTRDTNGTYYLGMVLSQWEYFSTPEAKDADIVNIVRCELQKVSNVDDVPGKVVACFRPTRTIQAIRDQTSINYSELLWNKLSGTELFNVTIDNTSNIFSFLSAEEAEDIIFIYLQVKGWVLIPNSRKSDTMSYEYYAIHKESKQKAIVQVKTGWTALNPKEWEQWKEKVFLFQVNGNYTEAGSDNVVCISPKEIEKFISDYLDIIPTSIGRWFEVIQASKI
ncbi:TPA: hypothetical protein ACPJ05_003199 [Vibrio diabolicus]